MKSIAVVGLGYVGLPLVEAASNAGLVVVGIDTNLDRVEFINSGKSPTEDLSNSQIAELVRGGFRAGEDFSIIEDVDAIFICVPTPLDERGTPDMSAVISAGQSISKHLTSGQLVVLESTTFPGTTEELLMPILEKGGLVAGRDFYLAYSPERIDPGNRKFNIKNTPKIVSGVNQESTHIAAKLYREFLPEVVEATGTREAETAKLLENTFRQVNIALVNEVAQLCGALGIDVWEVIRLASTKPFGFMSFKPGIGVGGHCIPIDPSYFSYKVQIELERKFKFVQLAGEINDKMPDYVSERLELASKSFPTRSKTVVILGVSYKANVSDIRNSPAVGLVRSLRNFGFEVFFCDPLVKEFAVDGLPLSKLLFEGEDLSTVSFGIIAQAHDLFTLNTELLGLESSPYFLDATGQFTGARVQRL